MKDTLNKYAKRIKTINEISFKLPLFPELIENDNLEKYYFQTNKSLKYHYGIDSTKYPLLEEIEFKNLNGEIKEADMIIINTLGNSERLERELELIEYKANTYIAIMNTEQYKSKDEIGDGLGLEKIIQNFSEKHTGWRIVDRIENGAGLTILSKIEEEHLIEKPIVKKRTRKTNGTN